MNQLNAEQKVRLEDALLKPEAKTARPTMPSLASIAGAWSGLPQDELAQMFPNLEAFVIGWGEPFCFRCGWLAPSRDADSYPTTWAPARSFDAAWNAAGGWLERAHLHDHRCGGSNDRSNFVPLCPLCHPDQPRCESRDEGIAYVNTPSRFAPALPFAQVVSDRLYYGQSNPGRDARHLLYRAYAEAGVIYAVARDLEGKGK